MASPSPQKPKTTIAILGAGIAGPVFAVQILSHPQLSQLYTPILFDRQPAPSTSGAAVALTSNAIYPLYSLGLKDSLNEMSCETERIKIWRSHSGNQKEKAKGRYLNQILSPNWQEDLGTALRVVERSALQGLLLERVTALGGEVVWGRKFKGLEKVEGGEGVKVQFESGEEVTADLVVGADGGWSGVRRFIISSIPKDGENAEGREEEIEKKWKPYFAGADAIYGISRRVEHEGEVGNGVEQREGDTHWVFLDGGMGSSWALAEGKVFWTLSVLSPSPPERSATKPSTSTSTSTSSPSLYGAAIHLGGHSLEATKATLEKYENAYHPIAGTFGNLLKNSEKMVRTPLYYRAWESDEIATSNVVLIGDAARLMLPTSGQGANFAIEDATILANALLNHPPSSQNEKLDFSAAISSYTALRIPRSKSMTKQSHWTGIIMSWADAWWLRWFVDLSTSWLPTGGDPKLRTGEGNKKDPMGWIYDVRYKVEVQDGGASGT
jgi:2-polyprenyl-6-methoxyphenol hydroxylase-like FAD-dependent oxidoreductase